MMINDCRAHIRKIQEDFKASKRIKDSLYNSIKTLAKDLYSKDSHFIFELIQNAEDNSYQEASPYISFRLLNMSPFLDKWSSSALIIHNNEIGFTPENVEAICAVGETTKIKIQGYIGEKGIGFKSVYRITSNPHIYSNGYSFCMPEFDPETGLGFIVPKWIDNVHYDINLKHTVIALPLDKTDFDYKKIDEMLREIKPETILFLSKLKQIEIITDSGNRIRIVKDDSKNPLVSISIDGKKENKSISEIHQFLVYSKTFSRPENVYQEKREGIADRVVTIAIPINNKRDIKGEIFAYLPIHSNTGFPFLINADFILTSSREAIQKDVTWNKWLIQCVAKLVIDALHSLKERGQLSITFLENLSEGVHTLTENDFFHPIAEKVRKALKNYDLLPANDGTFVSAQNAKVARSIELRNLLNYEQLTLLFKSKEKIKWLAGDITHDLTPNLRNYLIKQLDVEEVRPEKFIDLITEDFIENQDDKWIIDFYSFLGNDRTDLWKKPSTAIRNKKFIRLENGTHVVPFKNDGTPNAYLPSSSNTKFPTIKNTILESETAVNFLKQLGILTPDLFAEIIEFILPKYAGDRIEVDFAENIDDLRKIKEVLNEPYQGSSVSSLSKLRILLGKLGLAEFEEHFNRTETGKLLPLLLKAVLPSVRLVKASNGQTIKYRAPNDIYIINNDLSQYFLGNNETWFICDDYPDEVVILFKEFGINEIPKIKKRDADKDGFVKISETHGFHRRGLEGFDPDISVDGFERAMSNLTTQKSTFIWNKIALEHWPCIKGKVEESNKKTYKNSKKKIQISKFGRLLTDTAWLPSPKGGFSKPNALSLTDLPVGFEKDTQRAKSLSLAIGMKQLEREKAMEIIIRGDSDLKKLIEYYQSASDEERQKVLKVIPNEIPPEPVPSFKDGLKKFGRPQRGVIELGDKEISQVSNSDRYQNGLNERVEAGVREHQLTPRKIMFSPVKVNPSNAEARRFLYEQYHGFCQVTETTFPKASKNTNAIAENYFEACSLLPYSEADYLNDAGNMLCLSADTIAKFKYASFEFLENLEDVIKNFKNNSSSSESVSIRIRLAEKECSIKWSNRHFMHLVALYDKT